jgi:hypothetical protein
MIIIGGTNDVLQNPPLASRDAGDPNYLGAARDRAETSLRWMGGVSVAVGS